MELVFKFTEMDFMVGAFLWHLLNFQNRYSLETPLNVCFWVLDAVKLLHYDILSAVTLLVVLQFSSFSNNTPKWDNFDWYLNEWMKAIRSDQPRKSNTFRDFHVSGDVNHCVKSVSIRSYSGPHLRAFGLNTERYAVSLRIQSECGKMRTRMTLKMDTFRAVNATN